ncbi:hypothetical protein CU024_1218 [Enterococcus faecium]|nr:hypothetical protein [Enterococcus faecium]MBK4760625.1 hypothetical protein [Enterococcus faecium]
MPLAITFVKRFKPISLDPITAAIKAKIAPDVVAVTAISIVWTSLDMMIDK